MELFRYKEIAELTDEWKKVNLKPYGRIRIAMIGSNLLFRRNWNLIRMLCLRFPVELILFAPANWTPPPSKEDAIENLMSERLPNLKLIRLHAIFASPSLPLRQNLFLMPKLATQIISYKPHIVFYTHGPLDVTSWLCAILAKLLRIPYLCITGQTVRYPLKIKVIERLMFHLLWRCIAVTETVKKTVCSDNITLSKKIIVAPETGVDTTVFAPRIESNNLDSITVLYAGRLVEGKGLMQILESITNVKRFRANIRFVFCGNGPEQSRMLEYLMKHNLESSCVFLGQKPYARMPEVYRLADIFVYPSYPLPNNVEQHAFAVIEAMASGLAVVTTKCGSIPEIVGDCAIVVGPRNSGQLSSALIKLAEDKKLRKTLGTRGRQRVITLYSTEAVARKLFGLFEQAIEERS